LEATPGQLSPFMPRRQAIQQGTLLLTKVALTGLDVDSTIYLVNANQFRGFQYGRPQGSSNHFRVELFGPHAHLDLMFGQKINGSTMISQLDVNRIVQSIHEDEGRQ